MHDETVLLHGDDLMSCFMGQWRSRVNPTSANQAYSKNNSMLSISWAWCIHHALLTNARSTRLGLFHGSASFESVDCKSLHCSCDPENLAWPWFRSAPLRFSGYRRAGIEARRCILYANYHHNELSCPARLHLSNFSSRPPEARPRFR